MTTQDNDSRTLLAQIESARAALQDGARPAAIARQHERGKLTARERIDRLADPGSFREFGALVSGEGAHQVGRAKAPADGVITGTVLLDGRPAVVLGCAHSGLVNTLDRIAGLSNHARIHAVVGGMHLARASLGRLEATAQALGPFAPDLIAPCH